MKTTFFKKILICFPFLLGGIVISCQNDLADEVKFEEQKALKARVEKAKKIFEDRVLISRPFNLVQSMVWKRGLFLNLYGMNLL